MRIPRLGDALPQRGTAFTRGLGRAVLRCGRWSFEGEIPNLPKTVAIFAPHTSNWDFLYALAALLALGLDMRWIGKHTIFRPPFGGLMRWLGGIPVDRRNAGSVVSDVAARIVESERFMLGVAPEGTRKRVHRWKSGFYRIAVEAGVPILPVTMDYSRRRIILGPELRPRGDYEADLRELREFYDGRLGRRGD